MRLSREKNSAIRGQNSFGKKSANKQQQLLPVENLTAAWELTLFQQSRKQPHAQSLPQERPTRRPSSLGPSCSSPAPVLAPEK